MPQNNPAPASPNKSDTFSQGMASGDFIQIGASPNWFLRKIFTIPQPFTSIEFIFHVRTIQGFNSPQILWYSNMTPGEDIISLFDGNTTILPSAIAGGGANYPGIAKVGIGPMALDLSVDLTAGNLAGLPNYVPYFNGLAGIGSYIETTISSPIEMVLLLGEGAPLAPQIDGTIYNTFYK